MMTSDYDDENKALSHLSSQLMSHGYISRPLDLISLFTQPSAPLYAHTHASNDTTDNVNAPTDKEIQRSLRTARDKRVAQGRARDQVSKCLWTMLNARMDATATLEKLVTQYRVLSYDYERLQSLLKIEKSKRITAEKEQHGEKARAKSVDRCLCVTRSR